MPLSPRARRIAAQAGTTAAVALLISAAVEIFAEREVRTRRRGQVPAPPKPVLPPFFGHGLLDVDSEAPDEDEPAGIVYDADEPCETPPHPWEMPVSSTGVVGAEHGCTPPADLEPLQKTEVPFAAGGDKPRWPIADADDQKLRVSYEDVRGLWHGRWGRDFGATRKSTNKETGETYKRVHVGVDLFADDGDTVVAMEPGRVIATLPYYKGLGALYVRHDSGIIVNYGEIRMNSWKDFGIKTGIETGQRVIAGQPLAKVGLSNDGSHMLHVETFSPETTVDEIRAGEMRWVAGDPPPANVLDPTRYLVMARQAELKLA
jgi:murein DD-endopeptidase MepM/ murein hydrolase activator NlpD